LGVQVDAVEDTDELSGEHARHDTDLAAELADEGGGEGLEVGVVDPVTHARRLVSADRVEVADAASELDEALGVEPAQPQLRRPRVVEARVTAEVGGEPLRQR